VNVRVAVPRRDDGGHRDLLWDLCRRTWVGLDGFEVVEGHHNDGPFNRSAAVNAAAEGDWDVLVIADSDVAPEVEPLLDAVAAARNDGRVHLPYQRRMMVNQRGTQRILDGHVGRWTKLAEPDTNRDHCSSIVVLNRALWDEVGGFDERFEGWGAEDDAFIAACKTMAGPAVRHVGRVWHLWHPVSPHRDHRGPLYVAALALLDRYHAADRTELRRIIAERSNPDGFLVAVLTTGDRPELADTIKSIDAKVVGNITRKLLCVDGATLPEFDGWDTVQVGTGSGYRRAMRTARRLALGSGQPWVFWSEDDFTFNRKVDLSELRAEMVRYPDLVQMSLLRQAWYKPELEVGGVVETDPDAFERRGKHLAHRKYWTQNPHLCRRLLLAEHDWPQKHQSEWAFADQVFADTDATAGIWGDGKPWVTHIGEERAGSGY
jgi:hypothetical protein